MDVRNDYEIRIGKFKGAEDPKTEAFREFPSWVENRFGLSADQSSRDGEDLGEDSGASTGDDDQSTSDRDRQPNVGLKEPQRTRIAMYCTGGIRCEKATSYLIEKGFDEVSFVSQFQYL